jgi:CotH kinase protein
MRRLAGSSVGLSWVLACSSPTASGDGGTGGSSSGAAAGPTTGTEGGSTLDVATSSGPADSTTTTTTSSTTTSTTSTTTSTTAEDGSTDTTSTGEPDQDAIDAAWQAEFFSDAVIHDIAITLSDEAYFALQQDGRTYVSGDVALDGEPVASIGVRLRGKIGSYREISGKPKFKLDMSEYVPGQRFHGLHALALNNSVVDCSYLKEPLGYRVFRDAGVQASRTSFARVTVNDAAYGLYIIVEVPDGEFLDSRFPGDDDGRLYDGKYIYDWDTGNYTLLDFAMGVDQSFGLEEGESVGNADIVTVSEALASVVSDPIDDGDVVNAMDPLMDWDQWHRSWAVEQWIGHVDGYQMNRNNYRVYFRPSDAKMVYVPTDFDYGFIWEDEWGVNWSYVYGNLAAACYLDGSCVQAQIDAVETLLGEIDTDALRVDFDAMAELTQDDGLNDPRRECSTESVEPSQDALRYWIAEREALVRATWGL